jgi:hypothetical protein
MLEINQFSKKIFRIIHLSLPNVFAVHHKLSRDGHHLSAPYYGSYYYVRLRYVLVPLLATTNRELNDIRSQEKRAKVRGGMLG